MNEKKEIQDEIRAIANGLPVPPDDAPPPEYFDQLPDAILNRWKNEVSLPKTKTIAWKKGIAIAAILTGVCIGLFISNPKDQTPLPITSAEAFAYISENIDEFEGMIEVGNQESHDASWGVSPDAIHEYLIEESDEDHMEDLY